MHVLYQVLECDIKTGLVIPRALEVLVLTTLPLFSVLDDSWFNSKGNLNLTYSNNIRQTISNQGELNHRRGHLDKESL